MNGVTFFRGTRYGIGDLDLAILTDVGDPILVRRGGTAGDDALVDGVLASEIVAGQGNDAVRAGGGNDIVYGNQGDDLLYGNLGDDVLHGNLGADRFVFGAGSGRDLVVGFDSGQGDRLLLNGQGYTLGASAGGNALLALSGGGTVELAGITAAAFSGAYLA